MDSKPIRESPAVHNYSNPSERVKKPNLAELPNEMIYEIFSKVTNLEDLKTVCKDFNRVAVYVEKERDGKCILEIGNFISKMLTEYEHPEKAKEIQELFSHSSLFKYSDSAFMFDLKKDLSYLGSEINEILNEIPDSEFVKIVWEIKGVLKDAGVDSINPKGVFKTLLEDLFKKHKELERNTSKILRNNEFSPGIVRKLIEDNAPFTSYHLRLVILHGPVESIKELSESKVVPITKRIIEQGIMRESENPWTDVPEATIKVLRVLVTHKSNLKGKLDEDLLLLAIRLFKNPEKIIEFFLKNDVLNVEINLDKVLEGDPSIETIYLLLKYGVKLTTKFEDLLGSKNKNINDMDMKMMALEILLRETESDGVYVNDRKQEILLKAIENEYPSEFLVRILKSGVKPTEEILLNAMDKKYATSSIIRLAKACPQSVLEGVITKAIEKKYAPVIIEKLKEILQESK